MTSIDVSGSIGSLLAFYKHERRIFGRCPHCDEPFRLSEVKLTYGKEPPRDLLARMKRERDTIEEEIEALETEMRDLKTEHGFKVEALETKWRDKVESEVDKQVRKREKAIRQKAIAQSRAGQLGKTLEKVIPMFPGFGHHPYDVRPVFDPIDFVVFDGYYQGSVTDICFVEFKTGQSRITPVQSSIRSAIQNKRVHFEEKRLSKDAINMLTEGKPPRAQKLIKRLME